MHRGRHVADVFYWKNERTRVRKIAQYIESDASDATISRNLISDGIERIAGIKTLFYSSSLITVSR